MLPRQARLTARRDFSETMRRSLGSVRVARKHVVVHFTPDDVATEIVDSSTAGVRVGFIVSKAVGPAVTRNLVRRRLRHAMLQRLPNVPSGRVVVRALPSASSVDFSRLEADLLSALGRLTSLVSDPRSVAPASTSRSEM